MSLSREEIFADRVEPIVPAAIREKSVLIVGAGSGGGTLALNLAKSGCPKMTILDGETLEGGNISRHALGASYVGMNKAEALASFIRRERCPDAVIDVLPYATSYDLEYVMQLICTHDVTAACTDDIVVQELLNDLALRAEKPITFGTCRDGVEGGKAILVDPTSRLGCFRCVETLRGVVYKPRTMNNQYGLVKPSPGLGPFVDRIVFDQWWLTMYALTKDIPGSAFPAPPGPVIETTFVPLADAAGRTIARAHANEVRFLGIHPDCPICKELGRGIGGNA